MYLFKIFITKTQPETLFSVQKPKKGRPIWGENKDNAGRQARQPVRSLGARPAVNSFLAGFQKLWVFLELSSMCVQRAIDVGFSEGPAWRAGWFWHHTGLTTSPPGCPRRSDWCPRGGVGWAVMVDTVTVGMLCDCSCWWTPWRGLRSLFTVLIAPWMVHLFEEAQVRETDILLLPHFLQIIRLGLLLYKWLLVVVLGGHPNHAGKNPDLGEHNCNLSL